MPYRQIPRDATRDFSREDETVEEVPPEYFCKEIRGFKDYSRRFHEFFAYAEGIHNPRSLDRDKRDILESIVRDACQYPQRYGGNDRLSEEEKTEHSAIADKILAVSACKMGRSRKVYGNGPDDVIFISRNREIHESVLSYVDNNNLPHSLVCAVREGSKKTYEIDRVIKKIPLVFYTVNHSKYIDRWAEHVRVWSTIYKHSIIVDIPLYLIWALSQHAYIEVKHFLGTVGCENMVTTTMKYEFFKFADACKDYIPLFGTYMNWAIISAFSFAAQEGLITKSRLENSLLLNTNRLAIDAGGSGTSAMESTFLSIISPDNIHGAVYFYMQLPCFIKLIKEIKENLVTPETSNCWLNTLEALIDLGQILLKPFIPAWANDFINLAVNIALRALRLLYRALRNRSQARNYIGEETVYRDDGNYSLEHFLKTFKRNDVEDLLSDDYFVENCLDPIYRECVTEDEQNSQMIPIGDNVNAYISLTSIPVIIEKLLENSCQSARVYASEDKSVYEMSSQEASYKLYPIKKDKLNYPQFIYVEKE